MTPATYAKGGQGASIFYALTTCPLGRLLVAATLRGVCFVALGTRDGELIAQLHREYPAAAEITRDDERSEEHTSELQSLMRISYAVFCLKQKNKIIYNIRYP